jgi:hypothetical protein
MRKRVRTDEETIELLNSVKYSQTKDPSVREYIVKHSGGMYVFFTPAPPLHCEKTDHQTRILCSLESIFAMLLQRDL